MSDDALTSRYRTFLLGVTVLVLTMAQLELWFAEHTESLVQLIPFALGGVGLTATIVAIWRPVRGTLWLLRLVMLILLAGAMYGVYSHLSHNVAFEMEIRPSASFGEAFREGLFGASPLLAPGIFGLAALLALAATHRHPVLEKGGIR